MSLDDLAKRLAAQNAAARASHLRDMGRIMFAVAGHNWETVDEVIKSWAGKCDDNDTGSSKEGPEGPRGTGGEAEGTGGTERTELDSGGTTPPSPDRAG